MQKGATVVLVEHDMRIAARADHVIDLGPGAGSQGGRIVAAGTPAEVAASNSPSAPFLRPLLGTVAPRVHAAKTPAKTVAKPSTKKRVSTKGPSADDVTSMDAATPIEIRGAREHNLKNLTVRIPREQLVVVTGPSGSGKTHLLRALVRDLQVQGQRSGWFDAEAPLPWTLDEAWEIGRAHV